MFGEVFLGGGVSRRTGPLRDVTRLSLCGAPSRPATSPAPIANLPSIIWGKKMWQNVSFEEMDLFLVPQMLDFTVSCQQPVSLIPARSHFSSEDIQRMMINLILVFPFLNKILGEKKKVFSHLAAKEALLHLAAEVQVGQRVG